MATPHRSERVPSKPFADWLDQRVKYWELRLGCRAGNGGGAGLPEGEHGPIEKVCQEVGWPNAKHAGERRVYRMRRQLSETSRGKSLKLGLAGERVTIHTDWFKRDVVEEALFHAGVPFGELYPEIVAAEELELEPEGWCPGCRELRTPINGVCPFCEWRIGPKTGQVLLGRRFRVAA